MRTSSISNLNAYLPPVYFTAVRATGTPGNNENGVSTPTVQVQPDSTQLSPLAQLLSQLQQLQLTDPTRYEQLTGQIARNLQSAALAAQSGSDTTAAQLSQLATDFSHAPQTGQLPDIQNLGQAVGGASNTSDSSSSTSSTSSLDTSLLVNQYLAGAQASGSQSDSQNPLGIILNTLSSAGISPSNF